MDFLLSVMPLAILIVMMTLKKGVPSYIALPLSATFVYALQLFYFHHSAVRIHASVLSGLLTAWTPILILWGAIFFFKTMEAAGSLNLIQRWLNGISQHPLAQLMIIGWAFSFFIEGISGFGTPAVLAAPLLAKLGFDLFRIVIFCLAMNTFSVSFGAVGTPMWFGFGELDLSDLMQNKIGFKTALLHGISSLVIPLIALRMVVSWAALRSSLPFVYLSILSTMLPYIFFASFNIEFPSIAGGLIGLLVTVFLAEKQVGLSFEKIEGPSQAASSPQLSSQEYLRAFFPLAAVVLLLVLTRIKPLGIQDWLTQGAPLVSATLGYLGELRVSSSLVFEINKIFLTDIGWEHPLLYVPSLIPFALISLVCFVIFRISAEKTFSIFNESIKRIATPLLAMCGAMVFVKLFMLGENRSPASLLGYGFAEAAGGIWNFAAVYLGALGSFFAGSATISNLTFGPIQVAVAEKLGLDLVTVLSLQSVGGAMGNMVCIHNIVAVCAVLGLKNAEGKILRKTAVLALAFGLVAGTAASFMS